MVVDGENIDLRVEWKFHDINYIINITVEEGPVLIVDVEQVNYLTRFFKYSQVYTDTNRIPMAIDGMEDSMLITLRKSHTKLEISRSFLFLQKCSHPL
jgi:hypothetical protein